MRKFIFVAFFSLTALTNQRVVAQETWSFKSPEDSFEVRNENGVLKINEVEIEKKNFDRFLKLLLKPNRKSCPALEEALLTVEAKSGALIVTKRFFPKDGIIESGDKCTSMEFKDGWGLPFHREWFLDENNLSIALGPTMKFASRELNFTIRKKGDEWVVEGRNFIPDLQRMVDFAQSLSSLKVDTRYSKAVLNEDMASFQLTTAGRTYRFTDVAGKWAISIPGKKLLVVTSELSMLGKFQASEIKDLRSDDLSILSNSSAPTLERKAALERLQNVDTAVFKKVLHKIVRNPDEPSDLVEKIGLFLVDRPSLENLGVLMELIENGSIQQKFVASKVLKRVNPGGLVLDEKDQFANEDRVRSWKQWYSKYRKANKL